MHASTCQSSDSSNVDPNITCKPPESLVLAYLVKALCQPPLTTDDNLLVVDKQNLGSNELLYGKEIVRPSELKTGAKTRKSVITKYSTRQGNEDSGDLSKNPPCQRRGLEFVTKTLTKDHEMDAHRELKALKALRGHAHIVEYLAHVTISGATSIAVFPAAFCDLSDLLSEISQSSSGKAWTIPGQCLRHEYDVSFLGKTECLPLGDTSALKASLYADYECQVRALWSFFPCLCSALAWIHRNKFCHRDIKPDNILVESNGKVTIADLGSAETFDTLSRCNPPESIRQLRGCAKKFLAPEVYRLETCHEAKSDVFSLGIVFTKILTVIAGKTLSQYSEYRLGIHHDAPHWKQPVYALTLPEVCQWLQELIEAFENAFDSPGGGIERGVYRQLVDAIVLMIEGDRKNRLTAEEACVLLESRAGLKCFNNVLADTCRCLEI